MSVRMKSVCKNMPGLSSDPDKFLVEVKDFLDSLREQGYKDIYIDLVVVDEYGSSSYAAIEFMYSRPMTSVELQKEKEDLERTELYDKKQLEKLIKKYGVPKNE